MKVLLWSSVLGFLGMMFSTELLASHFSLSPSRLSFAVDSDSAPSIRGIVLTAADQRSRWQVTSDARWLEFTPARGHGSQLITVRIVPSDLRPGHYNGTLTVTSLQPEPVVRQVEVAYTVHPRRGISVLAGNHQIGVVGRQLPKPLVVQVRDGAGKPVADMAVTFTTMAGTVAPARVTVATDKHGMASFHPTLLHYGAVGITASFASSASREPLDDAPAYFQAVATGWTSTLAGDGVQAWGGDGGPAAQAQFNAPFGLALRGQQLLVVDYFNHALRAINLASGMIEPIAGTAKQGFNGDGLDPLHTALNGPFGIALSPTQDIIFSDYYNQRIRMIDRQRGHIVTLAGTGHAGYSGDEGPASAARIDVPLDIAVDSKGNIYVSDWHHHVVRKINAHSARIDTIAGTGHRGYNGEGPARQVSLSTPLGLSVDRFDNLYIADYGNNRVRKLDAQTGLLSTVAGSGRRGFSGDDGLAIFAELNRPYNVYADQDDGLFISDAGNHRVRHVGLTSGMITTVAGQGQFGYSGDGKLARNAALQGPFSVLKDDQENLYIAEYFGHRIRRISPAKVSTMAAEAKTDVLIRQARQLFGELPETAASLDNPATPAKVELGRLLFHDERLSLDGTVSCASCHALKAFGIDGQAVSQGVGGRQGTRNSPTVFNAALQDAQFWDGREATVESQAKQPLLNVREMAMPDEASVVAAIAQIPAYLAYFTKAFPQAHKPITFSHITNALAAFQRSLLTPDAPLDYFIAGQRDALSTEQLLGLEVFLREGCASCHAGPLLGGQVLHLQKDYPNTPAGTHLELRKQLGNRHTVKIPPLRNIAMTAPYLHDGSDATLAETITGQRLLAYMVREAGIRDTVDLSERERQAIVAFFSALTGVIDPAYIDLPLLPR